MATLAALVVALPQTAAQTGTFIDRQLPTDLRVVSYNVEWDQIFPDRNPDVAAKFMRMVTALGADILNLQEIGDPFCTACTPKTATDVRNLLNSIAPLPGGASWSTHKGSDAVIASKYPLSMQRTTTIPAGDKAQAIALVDLPDAQFEADFYFLNEHYKCCSNVGDEDQKRQKQSDSIVNWLRDARSPGGNVNLPPGTPFAVVGDLNIVGGPQPLQTLIDGNISDEVTFGSNSPPDWDGSNLTDLHPLHNGIGPADYTWRDDGSSFAPGRLDYIIYSDSALDVANSFVLNTVDMSPSDLSATGLQQLDVVNGIDGGVFKYDHLPLVVDFRLFTFATSDFNFSRWVDGGDLAAWETGYGMTSGASRSQGDADGDGDVDGSDFLLWQRQYTGVSVAVVPEPSAIALLALGCLFFRRGLSS